MFLLALTCEFFIKKSAWEEPSGRIIGRLRSSSCAEFATEDPTTTLRTTNCWPADAEKGRGSVEPGSYFVQRSRSAFDCRVARRPDPTPAFGQEGTRRSSTHSASRRGGLLVPRAVRQTPRAIGASDRMRHRVVDRRARRQPIAHGRKRGNLPRGVPRHREACRATERRIDRRHTHHLAAGEARRRIPPKTPQCDHPEAVR